MAPTGTEVPAPNSRKQRCVLLGKGSKGPKGPAVPPELLEQLTADAMDVRRCDSSYMAMAELVLHETARRAGWHREDAMLVVVEPDSRTDIGDLIDAALRWTTRTRFWQYTSGPEPRLRALPVETGAPKDEPVIAPSAGAERPRPAPKPRPSAQPTLRLAQDPDEILPPKPAPAARAGDGVSKDEEDALRLDDETVVAEPGDPKSDTSLVLSEDELSMLLSPDWQIGRDPASGETPRPPA